MRLAGTPAPTEVIVSFIDDHRAEYGVEPIYAQLPIAPSTYYEYKAREANPERLPEGRVLLVWRELNAKNAAG